MNGESSSVFRRLSGLKELPAKSRGVLHSEQGTKRSYRNVALTLLGVILGVLLGLEMHSWLETESRLLAIIARRVTFSMGQGASDAIQYSGSGPYDVRLGYSRLPAFLHQLETLRDTGWRPRRANRSCIFF